LLPEIFFVPGFPIDSPDHAEGIAGGRQKNRNCPSLNQRPLVQRFVIVAVEEHQIALA
jgi:hypothetical protein